MNPKHRIGLLICLATLAGTLNTLAQTTSFSYQGHLTDSGSPANGIYDLQFALLDAATNGNTVGGPITVKPVGVMNGGFTVMLDFGATAFPGANRWLQVGVRTNGSTSAYTMLAPLQAVTSTPYAIQALSAQSAPFNGLSGLPVALGNNTIGSTGKNPLEFYADGVRALRLEPDASGAPNVIGGAQVNFADSGVVGATIGGGGATNYSGTSYTNEVASDFGTIGGGSGNTIQGGAAWSTIGGGIGNVIQPNAFRSTIGGGFGNLIQGSSYDSMIGGGFGNSIQAGAYQSTIAGGQANSIQASANWSTIGGGNDNLIQGNATDSTIGGGFGNSIQTFATYASIGGGRNNTIEGNANDSTIAGGDGNSIQTGASWATMGGGQANSIHSGANNSTLAGGYGNSIQTNAYSCAIGGGNYNTIQPNAYNSTIAGGFQIVIQAGASSATIGGGENQIIQPNAFASTIAGGDGNVIQNNAFLSTIGGGFNNLIQTNASDSTIGGGTQNVIQTGATYSTIAGGEGNTIQANGHYGMIPGGQGNVAANFAFAAGYNACATNTGAFVWSDGTGTLTASTNANSVTMRAGGGFAFLTGTGNVGASLPAGGTSWSTISDSKTKKNFQPIDTSGVLEKLAAIPVEHWNYRWEPDDAVPHLGPVAQDFKAAFYPGRDDKSITTLEFDGVELAAIQGLNQKVEAQKAELAARERQIDSLEKRLAKLEKLVQSINR
jgi:hypothetical protein